MQSEGGAAAALHGAVQKGALATSFTSSQGLLLMIPTMFKVGGELTPTVLHVAARAVATHALSIFGDHSDVMAVRSTGWAMLCASDVQEAHDFALVAHAATLRSRVPFLHFFDGFRTSHEVATIRLLDDDDLRAVVREAGRARAPRLRPHARGAGHARQRAEPRRLLPVPRGVQPALRRRARRSSPRSWPSSAPAPAATTTSSTTTATPRPSASSSPWARPPARIRETVDELVRRGEKVGVAVVRLYRPFPADALRAALPATVTRIAVLDRTKEPGAPAEPLHLDVMSAFSRRVRHHRSSAAATAWAPRSSRRPTRRPCSTSCAADDPRHRFTVGIVDDVTHLSLDVDPSFRRADPRRAGDVLRPRQRRHGRREQDLDQADRRAHRPCTRRATSSTTRRSPAR